MGDQLDEDRLARAGSASGENLIELDPPRHMEVRRVLSSAFTRPSVARLESRVREIVDEVLSSLDDTHPLDLVASFVAPIPIRLIAELLGAPAQDWPSFKLWSEAMVELIQPDTTPERAAVAGAHLGAMNVYLAELLAEKRASPADDLISLMMHSDIHGDRLSAETVHTMCVALLVAGNETTRSLLAGGAYLLAQHQDQRQRLVAEPANIPAAVEECLRVVSPVTAFIRTATEDTAIAGQPIAAGDCVAMFYRSANRDETVWPDPLAFDAFRPLHKGNLTFGWGEHVCLGAHLARLEARIAFGELLRRYPNYQICDDVRDLVTPTISTVMELPVVLR
ncbi:cytochrome P450 [Mycobacterium sp. E1747]|uniref:cytochrome P450 n=1 Tax=Mycobacterium sp. E1747 TaxID=1834128 RepID=UPI0018D36D8A|nr:cytochrome P450 [Mycobacterium sp. E1747]